MPYKVIVVVDPEFGEQLARLPAGVPVWIVDTDANRPVAHRLWNERPDENHLTGITTFRITNPSPEENLIQQLSAIDLHHGPDSADPPYSELEVIGTPLTERVKSALAEFDFDQFSSTQRGFLAARSSRPDPRAIAHCAFCRHQAGCTMLRWTVTGCSPSRYWLLPGPVVWLLTPFLQMSRNPTPVGRQFLTLFRARSLPSLR